jgi:hypothetical protein
MTGEPVKWGWLPLHVTDHNTTAQLTMSTGAQITGRILATPGNTPDAIGSARTRAGPVIQGMFIADRSPQAKSENTFVYSDLAWAAQELSVTPDRPETYVKEIRYNGVPVTSPLLDLLPMGSLDVVLDSNAAAVNGIVTDYGKLVPAAIFLLRWPAGERTIRPVSLPPYQHYRISNDGRFSIASLPPGDYRILALQPNRPEWRDPAVLQRLLSRAERITLERGSQHSLELKMSDPSR